MEKEEEKKGSIEESILHYFSHQQLLHGEGPFKWRKHAPVHIGIHSHH